MKAFCIGLGMILSLAGAQAFAADPVNLDDMGLAKGSPIGQQAAPKPFELNAGQYRKTIPGAPAMVPHQIDTFVISAYSNPCVACHAMPERRALKKETDLPTSMPLTHWVKDGEGWAVHGSRHQCNLCHLPQADVPPLVPEKLPEVFQKRLKEQLANQPRP